MGLHTATGLNRWVKSAEAKTLHAGRLNIGPRLILGFALIILSMLAADAVVLWQFHVVHTHAGRLIDIDQKLVAVLRVHTSLLAFRDRLDALADSEDAGRLVTEAEPLRTAVLEDIRRATSALSLLPFDIERDPTILPTLHVIQSALPSQLEAITTLATSGDWRAVHLRLANQVWPLVSLASTLVEKVFHEAGEEQAQSVLNIRRVQRLVFLVVPLTAVVTLLIAATLGLAITRSITQPLARLVEGSKALARGEFQHQVSITGKDELAHLGHVFNDAARRLRDLYATLQSNEDRLRRVIDTIPAHAWSALPDGSVDFINRRFLEFTGRSLEDLLGWGWGSVIHLDDLTRYFDQWRAAVAAGEPLESEARVRQADGNYRWLLIRNVPLRDEMGNIINWYGTAIDIEERRRAEDALRRSETYLNDAQRVSHTGSWRHDLVSGEVTISPEGFRIWGIKPDEDASVTEFFFGRMHPEDAPLVAQAYAAARLKKVEFQSDFRIVLPDGIVKNIHSVGHPILNLSGDIIEFVGAALDVTERKRAEEALRQAQADLAHVNRVTTMGELAASIAHEVNQPLAAVALNANACLRWLARESPDLDEAREAARRVIRDGNRANEVITRLRALVQKTETQKTRLDINEAIEEVVLLTQNEAARKGVRLRLELTADLPPVFGDRVQLQQVILNLVMNGVEAMGAVIDRPRELLIRSHSHESGHVLIAVQDCGVGIAREDLEKIFNAFYTTKSQGMGMGLAISRSIIEAHGGRLWATPNAGDGATIQFTLPLNSQSES
jgi:PAS domain S-box-containing protein